MANPTPSKVSVSDPHGAASHGGDGHSHGHEDVMLTGYDGKLYPAHLQHHFVSSQQQFEASKLGMWLFLVTEILLFGALFVAYGIFRAWYPELFAEASAQLDTLLGALNTLVLLGSSLTMAWAIRGAQTDNQKVLFWNLIATIALASCFMVVKYFEYTHKFHYGIFPGANFQLVEGTPTVEQLATGTVELPAAPVEAPENPSSSAPDGPVVPAEATASSERTDAIFENRRAGIFFSIYYVMTGIHGLHVIIGIIAISILAYQARKGRYSSVYYTPVENVGLYWHVVDVIWIFLFPLMYLI
ncbi:MAG: cytochrome c oxidase subunit 3 family protein [Rubricoccaceae bacterium]